MPAGVPFAGKIADFILMKAVLRERLPRKLVHIAIDVLIRKSQLSRSDIAADRRSFLNDQAVTGEMRGGTAIAASSVSRTSETVCEGRPNIRSRLILSNPAFTRNFYGSDHLLPIMDPADEPQKTRCLACAPMDSRLTPALRSAAQRAWRVFRGCIRR